VSSSSVENIGAYCRFVPQIASLVVSSSCKKNPFTPYSQSIWRTLNSTLIKWPFRGFKKCIGDATLEKCVGWWFSCVGWNHEFHSATLAFENLQFLGEKCATVKHVMKCIYVENHAVFPFTLIGWHHFQNISIPMASFLNPLGPQIERVWYWVEWLTIV